MRSLHICANRIQPKIVNKSAFFSSKIAATTKQKSHINSHDITKHYESLVTKEAQWNGNEKPKKKFIHLANMCGSLQLSPFS